MLGHIDQQALDRWGAGWIGDERVSNTDDADPGSRSLMSRSTAVQFQR